MITRQKSNMMVFAETPCDFHTLPSSIFHVLIERWVTGGRAVKQGLRAMLLGAELSSRG